MLQLFQAEWCPYSRRVRHRLTELGIDFVARQVPVEQVDRVALREATGTDSIPTLLTEDGAVVSGSDEILTWLHEHFEETPAAAEHRAKAAKERAARH